MAAAAERPQAAEGGGEEAGADARKARKKKKRRKDVAEGGLGLVAWLQVASWLFFACPLAPPPLNKQSK